MAQYFTDFTEYTPSQSPDDWTERFAGGAGLIDASVPNGGGAQAMRSNGELRYSWDEPGTPSGDVEVYARLLNTFLADTTDIGNGLRIFLHGVEGGGSPPASNYYFNTVTTVAARYTRAVAKFVNDSASIIGWGGLYTSLPFTANTWYSIVLRREETDIKLKAWADESESDPGSYEVVVVDAILTQGFVGAFRNVQGGGVLWVDKFGVGTDGDPAPTEPVGSRGWLRRRSGIVVPDWIGRGR